jgi:uncharacterized protein YybS (DUF2232 family)
MMLARFPLVSVGKAVAATVIISVLAVYLVIIAPVFAVLLPLPVAYVTARHGWLGGAAVVVVSALLLYPGTGPGVALLTFLLAVSLGLTLGWALRGGWRFSRSLAVMSGALLAALVVYGIVLWLGYGVTYTVLKQDWYTVFNSVAATYKEAGMSAATADEVTSYAHRIVDVSAYIAPGILGAVAVLGAACTAGLGYLIFPRLRKPQAVRMSLSGFRMHWAVAYVSIVGLALLLFTRSAEGWKAYLFYAGIDLLLVSQTLFFLQALGVLRWLGNAREWRSGPRVLAFISAVVAQLFQFTGLIGLLDTWIDYRKRLALKGSGPGSTR